MEGTRLKKINIKLVVNLVVLFLVFFIGLIVSIIMINNRFTEVIQYMIELNEVGTNEVNILGINLVLVNGTIDSATEAYSLEIVKSGFYNIMPILVGTFLVCITVLLAFLTKVLLRKSFIDKDLSDNYE